MNGKRILQCGVLGVVLLASGCARVPLRGTEGALRGEQAITFLGVDFSYAAFSDPALDIERLKSYLGICSARSLEKAKESFPLYLKADYAISSERNQSVSEKQLHAWPRGFNPEKLTPAQIHKEIQPYLNTGLSGYGILYVAEDVIKEKGLLAHWIIFNLESGEVVLIDRGIGRPSGFGKNYYLNAMKRLSKEMVKTVRWSMRR